MEYFSDYRCDRVNVISKSEKFTKQIYLPSKYFIGINVYLHVLQLRNGGSIGVVNLTIYSYLASIFDLYIHKGLMYTLCFLEYHLSC